MWHWHAMRLSGFQHTGQWCQNRAFVFHAQRSPHCCPSEERRRPSNVQDLELPPELSQPQATAGADSIFVAPSPGLPASQRWTQKCNLAAELAAAGDFSASMRLLNR